MKLDIHDAVVMAVILAAVGALVSLWSGLRRIRHARKIAYYRMSRKQRVGGVRTVLFAVVLIGVGLAISFYAEPVAYTYFPPSPTKTLTPTISLTPTITLTPSITETPTITLTPAESYTPTITLTPFMPVAVEAEFTSVVTPGPDSVFSPLIFSLSLSNRQPVNPQTVFQNPLKAVYVTYSYDKMTNGVQWSALWYRDGQLLRYETSPWEGGTGGYGEYALEMPQEQWLPGTYQLIFFVGTEWKVLGEFLVKGNPPTPTFTPTASVTRTPSITPPATVTHFPTFTPHFTDTRWPTPTK